MLGRLSFIIVTALIAAPAFGAQQINVNGHGTQGHAGFGFSYFTVASPSSEFKFDPGMGINLGGERGFGFLNLALTFAFNYFTAEGTAHYRHVTLSGATTYDAVDAKFKQDLMNVSLGLKLRLIDGYWFRPYVEGGGSFGYDTLKFNFTNTQKAAFPDQQYKDGDSLFALGKYAEGGVEVEFAPGFGLFLAARMEWIDTKEFDVLYSQATGEKQKLIYSNLTYFVGVHKQL